jgi:transcriptional regulator with XRE-family HTH domain
MPKNNALKRFGKNIRDRREALGLSQEALAEKASLDRTYIGGVERGVTVQTKVRSTAAAREIFWALHRHGRFLS